jgi:hypothetical protein
LMGSRFTVPLLVLAVVAVASVPAAMAIGSVLSSGDCEVVSIEGTVEAFVCCSTYPEDCDCELSDEREGAFVMVTDDMEEVLVTFGPWWYWDLQDVTVKDVVKVGDAVNVTGVLTIEDDLMVLHAWHIENLDTGEEITIKVEGRPPWAGGPEELGVVPWPPSQGDE